MPHVQLLAYCRYIQLWTILYISRIINISPMSSLIVTSGLHLVTFNFNSKRIGILSLDIIQMLLISSMSRRLYILENIFIFSIYINVLLLIEKDPISLYLVELRDDDITYKDETFFAYINRIFSYMFSQFRTSSLSHT